ncbi:glucan biosynthesis protein [Puniceibacterium antarcticum]|uniref:glucan biosynthesis protein n=1 Tax=Puniceibacterium antarcticum TaxID=1206336 RepID=UPI001FE3DA91|nr:glucan biosynthesis protein G [Puniceibacterium antarcticum]
MVLAGLAPHVFGVSAHAQTTPSVAAGSILVPTEGISGSFESLVKLASDRSKNDADLPTGKLSGIFDGLNSDQYRAIRPESLRLQADNATVLLDALPPGTVFSNPVKLSVIDGDQTFDVRFDPAIFSFDPRYFDPEQVAQFRDESASDTLGYSGFRLRAPLNRPDELDEFIVFQGASYFRGVARGMVYGLSARGLAIDTAAPEGEEFPRFIQFWIEAPEPNSQTVVVRALLESRSCTGAFQFEISPGETTVMQTRCKLFPRRDIDQIGIAPLTSMFFFGPSRRAGVDDFRDAVHDSSGLQMVTGDGRRIWRSLANPTTLQVSAFADENPKGFGLSQRQRDFEYYQDAEARYEKRPSGWVEPIGSWGRGSVLLVEIPVKTEFNDNIVAFWRPEKPLGPSEEGHEFNYRVHWCATPPDTAPLGRAYALRSGALDKNSNNRILVIDFRKEMAWVEGITVQAWANGQPVENVRLRRLPDGKSIRASFAYDVGDASVTEFEMTLMGPEGPESETWLYRLARS